MIIEELLRYGIAHTEEKTVIDASPAVLIETAVERGEGELTSTGSLSVITGQYTGRSPQDRFIVDTPDVHDKIAWGKVNVPFSEENYQKIKAEVIGHLSERRLFVVHGLAGATAATPARSAPSASSRARRSSSTRCSSARPSRSCATSAMLTSS